ncbi:MAG TPA: PP2C family protein-serine/threonine phosphatase [Candidatus Babeliales bacterium]|jgi:serine/threonine protein phosphatase PrpC|nr:PP2C family protein-serine/threonine phosphatase [Candidatus Babeliales bacterium]
MKFLKSIISLVALLVIGIVFAKQITPRGSARAVRQQKEVVKEPVLFPEAKAVNQPIGKSSAYNQILTKLKTIKPSHMDYEILKQINDEVNNQMRTVEETLKTILISPQKPEMKVVYGLSTHQNKRSYQEDRSDQADINGGKFFAVYDGHGGANVSSFLKSNLHTYFTECLAGKPDVKQAFECAFLKAENYALSNYEDGSTAVVTFIDKNNVLHCAWVGDSRAVLESNGRVGFATQDHKPDRYDERKRIENAGGEISVWGVWRVNGLAVSRSIGDKPLKDDAKGQIIAVPECVEIPLTADNHFLILASDGLWDVIKNEDAVAMVTKELAKNSSLDKIAQALQNDAIAKGSGDNITVCVIKLNVNSKK